MEMQAVGREHARSWLALLVKHASVHINEVPSVHLVDLSLDQCVSFVNYVPTIMLLRCFVDCDVDDFDPITHSLADVGHERLQARSNRLRLLASIDVVAAAVYKYNFRRELSHELVSKVKHFPGPGPTEAMIHNSIRFQIFLDVTPELDDAAADGYGASVGYLLVQSLGLGDQAVGFSVEPVLDLVVRRYLWIGKGDFGFVRLLHHEGFSSRF